MFYNDSINMANAEMTEMITPKELDLCVSLIENELKQLNINANLKAWIDGFGSYVEISCVDLSSNQKKLVEEIQLQFEKILTETKFTKKPSVPQVDYVVLKLTYSKNYKQKVWSWMQKQFADLASLPKNYYELENYHTATSSNLPALQLLNEALDDRHYIVKGF